jgi:hypothetical protein
MLSEPLFTPKKSFIYAVSRVFVCPRRRHFSSRAKFHFSKPLKSPVPVPGETALSGSRPSASPASFTHPFQVLKKKTKEKRLSIEKKRKVFLNAYKKWTQDEDYQLIALYQQGFSIFNLMIEFKRNEGAIKSRIKKLLQK